MQAANDAYHIQTLGQKTTPNYIADLRSHLTTKALTRFQIYDSIDSTSAYLMRCEKKEENLVVIAHTQNAGRGRGEKQFDSPLGGMYMSIYQKTTLPPEHIHFVTVASALAVYDTTVSLCHIQPAIKWVNDVLVGGKKICGILVNGLTTEGELDGFIAGIGVNLNTPQNTFASSVTARAQSIAALTGRETNMAVYIATLLNAFEAYVDQIATPQGRKSLAQRYGTRLNIIGKEITIDDHKTTYRAKCLGTDEACRLLLQLPNGETKALDSGEIITIHHL